jgi:Homeodomain-like domain
MNEVARRYGVSRQAVHGWLGRYESDGLTGLADYSHRPRFQPRQLDAQVEALICQLRGAQPRWGARRLLFELGKTKVSPLPSRSTVHRVVLTDIQTVWCPGKPCVVRAAVRGFAAPAAITVQRRVSSRGGIWVARQKIQAGMTHAGKIVSVVCEKNSFRLVIDGDTVAEAPRITSRAIGRYKACGTRPGRR